MQPDRFTIKSQEALQAALRLAESRRNPEAGPGHLLSVLLESDADGGVFVPVLRQLGVDPGAVRERLAPALERLPRLTGTASQEPSGYSSEFGQLLRASENE